MMKEIPQSNVLVAVKNGSIFTARVVSSHFLDTHLEGNTVSAEPSSVLGQRGIFVSAGSDPAF